MEQNNVFNGTEMLIPKFTYPGVTLSYGHSRARTIPNYVDGIVQWEVLDTELLEKPCFDYVWQLKDGKYDRQLVDSISSWVGGELTQSGFLTRNCLHVSSKVVSDREREHLSLVLLRVFDNNDFPCTEHPEFLFGPIGMYHCPVCGHMQMAGLAHLPIEEH